jgi:rod shape determining protein RodA
MYINWKAVRRFFFKQDWVILLSCIALSVLSMLLIDGILQSGYADRLKINNRNLITQGIAIVMGISAAVLISNIEYRAMVSKWKYYVSVAYLSVFATFIFGYATAERPDAKRWLIVPGIDVSVQPSEFLKLAFILVFAYHIYKVRDNINHPLHVLLLFLHGLAPVVLIQYQGDSGTALLFGFIFISMLFMSGVSWVYFAAMGIGTGIMIPVVWSLVLNGEQRRRILALFAGSQGDLEGVLFQQHRAALAISSGDLIGNGIFFDSHIYVPEMQNDFIFAFLGSSLGFLGCIAVLLVIVIICLKILINCAAANDKQGQMICIGVFAMIFFQSVINIGMCLSLLPVIGNSLPLISSGGSSVLANYIGIGLVLSVYKHTRKKRKVRDFLPSTNYGSTS